MNQQEFQRKFGTYSQSRIASLERHMKMLCETIGARPTGSAKNSAAVEYAFNALQKCGLQTYKQEFDCMDWKNSGATLLIDGKNVPIEPAEYSLPCDIETEWALLDTVDTLKNAELSGKIAVMHGDLCKEPLTPKNFEFYNPDEHKQIISLLEEKTPAAVITVNPHKEHIIQDGDFNVPCAAVSENTLDAFLRCNDRKARLAILTERIPTKAHNVIATHGAGHHKICFSAHIDTKPATPGALDNASGVSILLALAESLAGKECHSQTEIVILNGEDYYSNPGEIAYMNKLTSEYDLAVNVDGVGLKDSATSISFYECPKHIESRVMGLAKKISGMERIDPWPMGDHMIFAARGIPTVAITASNIFNLIGTVIHSPDDDMTNIDFGALEDTARFFAELH